MINRKSPIIDCFHSPCKNSLSEIRAVSSRVLQKNIKELQVIRIVGKINYSCHITGRLGELNERHILKIKYNYDQRINLTLLFVAT